MQKLFFFFFLTDALSRPGGDRDKLATERAGDASTAPGPQTPISRLITRPIEADACQSAPHKGERQEVGAGGDGTWNVQVNKRLFQGGLYRGTDP